MRKRQAVLLLVFMLAFGFHAWSQEGSNEYEYSFLRDPDFWLATSANLMGIGLFLSRVHAPDDAKWFGGNSGDAILIPLATRAESRVCPPILVVCAPIPQ